VGPQLRQALSEKCPGLSETHSHPRPLSGRNPDGSFKTQAGQEYPARLCTEIAKALLAEAVGRRQAEGGLRCIKVSPEAEVRARALEWEEREKDWESRQCAPLGDEWAPPHLWRLAMTAEWGFYEHNNVTEARTAVWAVRRAARSMRNWGRRLLVMSDSAVTIGAFTKGRSSSPGLLRQCRRLAGLVLGLGMAVTFRYVKTDKNNADGPSRGFGVGVAPKQKGPQLPRSLFKGRPRSRSPRADGQPEEQKPQTLPEESSAQQGNYGRQWAGFG
jgi:hypothetical protein